MPTPPRVDPPRLTGPLRSTAILAGGSALSLLAGAAAAKLIAVLSGTVGVGAVGLFASLLAFLVLLGSAGLGIAAVRLLASAISTGSDAEVRATAVAARRGTLGVSIGVALLAILLREPASAVLLNDPSQAAQVALVAAAVPFLAMAGVEVGVVNGFHRVARLSVVTGLTALVTGGSLVVAVWLGGTAAIGAGLLAGAVGAWVIARVASSGLVPGGGGRVETRAATGRLAGIGVPFLASQLLGTGAQLLLPFLVLAILSASDVGLYRAANTLSIAYLAFLLNAMAQDYFPRLSGAAGRPELAAMARTQLRLVMAIAVPVILVAIAAAPIAIEILYSNAFLPATDLLRWQLIGDLVKLPAWVISFVILARASGRRFLVVEAIGGLSFAVLGWAGLVAFGLEGTGIAYLVTYLIYFAVVALAARPSAGNLISRDHGLMGALVVACIAAQLLRPAAGDLPISGLTMLGAVAWVLLVSVPALRGRELGWRHAPGAA